MDFINKIKKENKIYFDILSLEETIHKLKEIKLLFEQRDNLTIDEKNLYNRVLSAYDKSVLKGIKISKENSIKISDLPSVFRECEVNTKNDWCSFDNENIEDELKKEKVLFFKKDKVKKSQSVLSEFFD